MRERNARCEHCAQEMKGRRRIACFACRGRFCLDCLRWEITKGKPPASYCANREACSGRQRKSQERAA